LVERLEDRCLLSTSVSNPAVVPTGNFAVNAVAGRTSDPQTVATFTDPGGAEALGNYGATINWGDNSSSAGNLSYNSGTGVFTVQGTHLYGVNGTYALTITITHNPAPPATVYSAAVAATDVEVLTQHNDVSRSGDNLKETKLTTSTVNPGSFGKLYTLPVDGSVYAQPLYTTGLMINGSFRNVVFVATMHNTVYAFDANSSSPTPLWSDPLGSAIPLPDPNIGPPGYQDIEGEVGILSTPAISLADNALYVVAARKLSSSDYRTTLYKLDLRTGAVLGSVDIGGSVPGTGAGSSGGMVAFQSHLQDQRTSLLLANGHVYIAFASYGDAGPYHGWVFGYNTTTLARDYIFNTTADGSEGGIWESGTGLTADANGNIYLMTGNGTSDPTWQSQGKRPELGESFVKLSPSLGVLDWFMVHNAQSLNGGDVDLGASGPLLIPGTNLLVGGGKEGRFYVLNKDNFGGHYNSLNDAEIVQNFLATGIPKDNGQIPPASAHEIHGNPVYWNGPGGPLVYVWGDADWARAYSFNGSSFPVSPNLLLLDPKETLPDASGTGLALVNANDNTLGLAWEGADTRINFETAGDGMNFGSKVIFGETTNFKPSLAYGNGRYYLAWTGLDGRLNVMSSTDGINWGNKVILADTSSRGPALAFGNGRVFLTWQGSNGDDRLNVESSTDGITWVNKVILGQTTDANPGLSFVNGKLYLTWRGLGNGFLNIMESTDGINFTNQVIISTQASNYAPALTFFQGRYYLGWTGLDARENILTGTSVNSLGNQQIFSDTSVAEPALVPFKGQVEFGWSGTDSPSHLNVATLLHPDPLTGGQLSVQGDPGGILSLTANGSQAGTGILWAYTPLDGDANQAIVHGKLIAYSATTMAELWDSQMGSGNQVQTNPSDVGGWYGKNVAPTVVNGKVFLATFANTKGPSYIDVYGLKSGGPDGLVGGDDGSGFVDPGPAGDGSLGTVPISADAGVTSGRAGPATGSAFSASILPGGPGLSGGVPGPGGLFDLGASSPPSMAAPDAARGGHTVNQTVDPRALDEILGEMAGDGSGNQAVGSRSAQTLAPAAPHRAQGIPSLDSLDGADWMTF
jgi:hypothetical protein